jgi:hypothetical protein
LEECCCNQRPTLKRATQPMRASRGRKKTTSAAAIPAAATSANPIWTLLFPDAAAATDAAGVSAAESRSRRSRRSCPGGA